MEEARDITIHLKPLRRLLDDMEQFDFSELDKIIPAILHTVGLIWANSKYYCRAPRVIVLLQELCNMLIDMVSVDKVEDQAVELTAFKRASKKLMLFI